MPQMRPPGMQRQRVVQMRRRNLRRQSLTAATQAAVWLLGAFSNRMQELLRRCVAKPRPYRLSAQATVSWY